MNIFTTEQHVNHQEAYFLHLKATLKAADQQLPLIDHLGRQVVVERNE